MDCCYCGKEVKTGFTICDHTSVHSDCVLKYHPQETEVVVSCDTCGATKHFQSSVSHDHIFTLSSIFIQWYISIHAFSYTLLMGEPREWSRLYEFYLISAILLICLKICCHSFLSYKGRFLIPALANDVTIGTTSLYICCIVFPIIFSNSQNKLEILDVIYIASFLCYFLWNTGYVCYKRNILQKLKVFCDPYFYRFVLLFVMNSIN